jgi:hypothetical protein
MTLDNAVNELKSLSQPAQAMGDMLASTLRGSVAATAGVGGDIRELIDLFGPEAVEKVLGKRVMPTTEEMNKMLPPVVPQNAPADRQHTAKVYGALGEFAPLPGTVAATKAIGYGAGRAAGAGTRMAGQAISDAMINQSGPLASGPLSALAPRSAMTNVVKPKGGNWYGNNVEKSLASLKGPTKPRYTHINDEGMVVGKGYGRPMTAEELQQISSDPMYARNEALNNWVDRNLTNYVKKEMATPDDPVRKLAEQNITHSPFEEDPGYWAGRGETAREDFGGTAMANSPAAKQWEDRTDSMIMRDTAQQHQDMMHLAPGMYSDKDEWIKKLPPDTPLYSAQQNRFSNLDLGFDHIMDVLREDLQTGRIRPEQLNKVSMEQAVRRTYEYDQELAAKMNASRAAAREGLPIHKEYPEGYRWLQLNKPGSFNAESEAMGHSVKGYEPPKGHPDWVESSGDVGSLGYGHGGWEGIKSGRAKVYSLVDSKGEPHVTIESKAPHVNTSYDEMSSIQRQADQEADAQNFNNFADRDKFTEARVKELKDELFKSKTPEGKYSITQIKGKSNRMPKEDYLQYVQDFVRNGEWSDVGDLQNTGLRSLPNKKYVTDKELSLLRDRYYPEHANMTPADVVMHYERMRGMPEFQDDTTKKFIEDLESGNYNLPEEGMSAGGTPRYPTEQEREAMRKLRESFLPAAKDAERLKRLRDNMERSEKRGSVNFSDNPDTMMMEMNDAKMAKAANDDSVHMAGGGVSKLAKVAKAKKAEELTKLERAPAKTKAEIEAIAQRIAPQMTGEYVRGSKGAKTVAGKTKKQFEREKTLEHDIRPTGDERPLPETVDIESLKGNVMMGIAGDPTITGQTVYGVAGRELKSPAPQHGGPYYGLGQDDKFWASQLGAAQGVQNRAGALSKLYEAPVVGNYVKMGPDSYSYAQHFGDTNLQNIRIEDMTKAQIEGFNKLVAKGSAKSGPRPSWAGIENPDLAYLQMAVDPELRKHFGNLMQMPTVTEKFGLPSGQDVAHAVTEPDLRNLEIGVTGKSLGLMRPDVTDLKLSEHPTYSHDIPGKFLGGLKYPTPYELMFPDSIKAVRENPAQAPQEFGSFKMAGPRQIIDPQQIDEIKQYEEFIKKYTGKAEGGEITVKPKKMAAGGELTAEDLDIEERPL